MPDASEQGKSTKGGSRSASARKPPASKKREDDAAESTAEQAVVYMREEEVDRSVFDEFDPNDDSGVPLRTLIRFTLCRKDRPAEMLTLDEIEEQRGNLLLRGTLVEPLPVHWRETMVSLLSTTFADDNYTEKTSSKSSSAARKAKKESVKEGETIGAPVDAENASSSSLSSPPPSAAPTAETDELRACKNLDWAALRVGDLVDGYCHQTYRWYEAKIVQIDAEKERYKVHFQGWNSKYDEWISKQSDRLVPHKTSALILKEAEENATLSLPWFDCEELLSRAAKKLHDPPLPPRREQAVEIEDIEDWCVDYSYANPTLWLVSQSGVWYRVAGALVPHKGSLGVPSEPHKPFFQVALEKYLVSAHVVMAVLDVFPSLPTAGLQVIADEIHSRTGGLVNEVHILEHFQFVQEQLRNIELPEGWSKRTSLEKSVFVNQLVKEGDVFHASGGMNALKRGTYKGPGMKKRIALMQEMTAMETASQKVPFSAKKARAQLLESSSLDANSTKVTAEPVRLPGKLIFPAEDAVYWQVMRRTKQKELSTPPVPQHSRQFLDKDTLSPRLSPVARFALQEQFLNVYAVLSHFRLALRLSIFSLFDLEDALRAGDDVTQSAPPLLREICISMLDKVLRERAARGELKDFFGPNVLSRTTDTTTTAGTTIATEDSAVNNAPMETAQPSLVARRGNRLLPVLCRLRTDLTDRTEEPSFEAFLREGEAWAETFRVVFDEEHAREWPFANALENTVEDVHVRCQRLLDEIHSTFGRSVQRIHTLRTERRTANNSSLSVLSLDLLQRRLKHGWYDSPCEFILDTAPAPNTVCDESDEGVQVVNVLQKHDFSCFPGQLIDVYNEEMQRWLEAMVVKRDYVQDARHNHRTAFYWIRYLGWGTECDELIAVDSPRIIPYKAASAERQRRAMTPDEILAKFPTYESVSNELWHHTDDDDDNEDDDDDDDDDGSADEEDAAQKLMCSRHRGAEGFADDLRLWLSSLDDLCESEGDKITNVSDAMDVENVVLTGTNVKSESDLETENETDCKDVKEDLPVVVCAVRDYVESRLRILLEKNDDADGEEEEKAKAVEALVQQTTVPKQYIPQELWAARLQNKVNSSSVDAADPVSVAADESLSVWEELESRRDVSLSLVALRWRRSALLALSLADKVQLLHWLCAEFLATAFATESAQRLRVPADEGRAEIDLVRCLAIEKNGDGDGDGEEENDMEIDNDDERLINETSSVKKSSKKRLSIVLSVDNENNDNDNTEPPPSAAKKRGRKSLASMPSTPAPTISSSLSLSTPAVSEKKMKINTMTKGEKESVTEAEDADFELSLCMSRSEPLGRDRFGNAYFLVEQHPHTYPLLLCELRCAQSIVADALPSIALPQAPSWLCIHDERDLRRLLDFLDERTISECQLMRNLLLSIAKHRMPVSLSAQEREELTRVLNEPDEVEEEQQNKEKEKSSKTKTPAKGKSRGKDLRKRFSSLLKKKRTPKIQLAVDFETVSLCREMYFQLDANRALSSAEQENERKRIAYRKRMEESHALMQKRGFEAPLLSSSAPCSRRDPSFHLLAVDFSGEEQQLGMGVKPALSHTQSFTHPHTPAHGTAVYVTSVRPLSLAARAGVRVGDRVLLANARRVDSVAALQSELREFLAQCATERARETEREAERARERETARESLRRTKSESAREKDRESERLQCLRERQWMLLLVQRERDEPLRDPLFQEITEKDPEVKKALEDQQQQVLFCESAERDTESASRVVQQRIAGVHRLLQSLCALCVALDHVACTSTTWRTQRLPHALGKLFSHVLFLSSSVQTSPLSAVERERLCKLSLCQTAATLLLDLETELFDRASIIIDVWTDSTSELRRQWRMLCRSASALVPERLSYALALLKAGIDRELVSNLLKPLALSPSLSTSSLSPSLTLEQALQQVMLSLGVTSPSLSRTRVAQWASFLKEGKRCVYFAEGHAEAQRELQSYFARFVGGNRFRRRTVLWGETLRPFSPHAHNTSNTGNSESSPSVSVTSVATNTVWLCAIKHVKILNALLPFAQITLSVHTNPASLAPPAVPRLAPAAPTQAKLALSRALERVLLMVKKSSATKPFHEPVDAEEYPDYYELVKKPMDLRKIEKRISSYKYEDCSQFLDDLQLIVDNCKLYNGEDDEVYLPIARRMRVEVEILCARIAGYTSTTLKNEENVSKENASNSDANDDDGPVVKRTRRSIGASSEAAVESVAPVPATPGIKSFTVCVRLDRDPPKFLLDYEVYCAAVKQLATMKPAAEYTVVTKTLSDEEKAQSSAKSAKGIIVGTKCVSTADSAPQFMPWKYLKVDWQEPSDALLSPFVNAWEFDAQ